MTNRLLDESGNVLLDESGNVLGNESYDEYTGSGAITSTSVESSASGIVAIGGTHTATTPGVISSAVGSRVITGFGAVLCPAATGFGKGKKGTKTRMVQTLQKNSVSFSHFN